MVTGPALQGAQTAITEGDGLYEISNLPPGTYLITVYYLEAETRRPNALVQLGKTAVVNVAINTSAESGEVITLTGRAPIIDQGSTKTGRTITQDFTENIPTGQTFGGVLGTAAGSQGDLYGYSFGGSTSAENTYIVEGINTTDPAYGLQSTNLPNEFIRETEVITGGYNAEYGRSTGGVINVLTKAGSNEFHGSVFTYYTPGSFTAAEVITPSAGSSIETNSELDYTWSLGAEVGGPVVKDKLWFHVGLNPTFSNNKLHRIINRRVDANGDGFADIDANGFPVLDEVDRVTFDVGGRGPGNLSTMYFTGKLTAALSPDHQGSVSFLGNPITTQGYGTLTGIPDAGDREIDDGAYDFSFKWTSKFNNNKTQIDAVAGFHRNVFQVLPNPSEDVFSSTPQIRIDPRVSLEAYDTQEGQYYNGVPSQCVDDDPSDSFTPCPVQFYNIGGYGFYETQTTDRLSALLSGTQRLKIAGQHTIKAGVDFEDQTYDHLSAFSGGYRYRLRTFGLWQADRWYSIGGTATGEGDVMEQCDVGGPDLVDCVFKKNGLPAVTKTRNAGAYLQDSWAILPNLTVNAGLRWEQQTLEVSDEIKTQADMCLQNAGTEGERLLCPDSEAFVLGNMLAPRVGVIYDPTQEGRSKINAHWGRFYESIPMDINSRAFGGEVFGIRYLWDCTGKDPNTGLPTPGNPDCGVNDPDNIAFDFFLGGGEEGVVPGIKGQYLDEFVVGGEYELLNQFKVGASYVHRTLGRVIEDISTDGGTTYIIANPGEANESAIQSYGEERAVLVQEGLITQDQLDAELDLYRAAADFDVPTRTYDALHLTAEKRFTKNLMLQGSYTYSETYGNFPGLFSPETGQLDPNLTSMYDLAELMANRTGPLAADRPHLFKLDGYYKVDVEQAGVLVFGTSIRAASGIPHNVLGSHPLYGSGESYILPRGSWERGVFTTGFDAHVSYGRRLGKNTRLEAFVRVFNLFNQQPPTDVSEFYTFDLVNPCVGCTLDDLPHVKALNPSDPNTDLSATLEEDPNFGNTTARQSPRSITLGARLTF